MIESSALFSDALSALTPALETAGFVVSDDYETAFGSRFTVFDGGTQDIRLGYDGKDSWLILEARPASHRQFTHGWVDLGIYKVDRANADAVWLANVITEMRQVLIEYLKEPLT